MRRAATRIYWWLLVGSLLRKWHWERWLWHVLFESIQNYRCRYLKVLFIKPWLGLQLKIKEIRDASSTREALLSVKPYTLQTHLCEKETSVFQRHMINESEDWVRYIKFVCFNFTTCNIKLTLFGIGSNTTVLHISWCTTLLFQMSQNMAKIIPIMSNKSSSTCTSVIQFAWHSNQNLTISNHFSRKNHRIATSTDKTNVQVGWERA